MASFLSFRDGLSHSDPHLISGTVTLLGVKTPSRIALDWVVRKPVNANPGLKVILSINSSCIKVFFAFYLLFSLRLFKFKREGQTI